MGKLFVAVAAMERLSNSLKLMGNSNAELLTAIKAIDQLQIYFADVRRAAIFALNADGVRVLDVPTEPPRPLHDPPRGA